MNRLYRIRPPGRIEKQGFSVVHFQTTRLVTRQEFYAILQDIQRRYAGIFQQVDYAVDNGSGKDRRLRIHARDMNTLADFIRKEESALIPNEDGSGGSESLIVPGEGAVIPNYSIFEVWFRGNNGGELNPTTPTTSTAGSSLPRIGNILSRRGLGAAPQYSAPGVPWVYQSVDNSDDPLMYEDDGNCLERLCNDLKIPFTPMNTLNVKDDLRYIEKQVEEIHGQYVHWVHPFEIRAEDLIHPWDQPKGLNSSDSYVTGQKGRRHLGLIRPETFVSIPQDTVPILFDGRTHAALAKIVIGCDLKRYIAVNAGFYECDGRIVRVEKKNKQDTAISPTPWVDVTRSSVTHAHNYTLAAGWKVVDVFDTEAEERNKWKERTRTGCLFFDFETVVDADSHHTPYAVSWLMVDVNKETGQPLHLEFEDFMKHSQVYVGADAADHLVHTILSCTWASGQDSYEYDRVLGVTFNGAGFDNHLLYEAFKRHNWSDITPTRWGDIKLDNEFLQGSQLVDFAVDTFFTLFDVRKHLVGSLKKNCDGFGNVNKKLGDFNHANVQAVYNKLYEETGDHKEAVSKLGEYAGYDLLPEGKTPEDFPDGPPKFLEHLTEYAKMDVASLGELFFRYREVANNLFDIGYFSVKPKMTLASESYAAFETKLRKDHDVPSSAQVKKKLKNMSKDDPGYEDYKLYVKGVEEHNNKFKVLGLWTPMDPKLLEEIRTTSIVAGRVQLFHEPKWYKENVVSMDVKSLYPYVMAVKDVYYPTGEHERYQDQSHEFYRATYEHDPRLGLWKVDIDQSHLKARNLPVVLASKKAYDPDNKRVERNDWHADHIQDLWITNEEIRILDKFDCKITFKDCILWADKMRSCDLFNVLTPLMKVKNQEDRKKDAKMPFNPALRTAAKLGSNALYGKMMEDFHEWRTMRLDAERYQEILDIVESGDEDREFVDISVCYPVGPDVFARVKKNRFLKKHLHTQRPMVVGFYILAYARMYMYEYALAPLGLDKCYYTDTDCIKTSAEAFETRLKPQWSTTLIPHWKDCETEMDPLYATAKLYEEKCKCYGGFENELEPNYGLITVAKKMWLVLYADVQSLDSSPVISEDGEGYWGEEYEKYPKKMFKCGMKGVQESDVILDEDCACLMGSLSATDPEWNRSLEVIYSDRSRTVGDNLLEVFARLLQGVTYFVKSNFVKLLTQHSTRVRWGEEDKYVSNYGRIAMRYSFVKVDPTKNQEVWPQEVRIE